MSTPSDYGEPWELTTEFAFDISIKGELAASFESLDPAIRALNCVNACQGMADPAAEIQAMRDAIKNFCKEQEWAVDTWKKQAHVAALFELAKLQPFIKP